MLHVFEDYNSFFSDDNTRLGERNVQWSNVQTLLINLPGRFFHNVCTLLFFIMFEHVFFFIVIQTLNFKEQPLN